MAVNRIHALTAGELALLRVRDPAPRTDLFLAIWPRFVGTKGDPFNATVFTCRTNIPGGVTNDRLYQIAYDGGSGNPDWNNTLPDMTVYVGTSAGAYDLGQVRLRGWAGGSDGTSGTMLVGEVSEIAWQDDAYLTVVDEFGIWPRHIYIDVNGNIFMDRGYYDEVAGANVDGSYTDQHLYPDPEPNLQPDAVVWLPSSGNARVYFDASDSFALDGGALSYSWAFPGSVANGGLASAATWVEYNTAGVYRAACQVTRNYPPQSAFTGYRRIFVFDEDNYPAVKFELLDCSGNYSQGGWSFRVRMWDEAYRSEIVDRAKCILFARDWYDGTEQSIGPIRTDQFGGQYLRPNTCCAGWIDGESITYDNEDGSVEFDVQGPKFWLEKITGFPHGVENSDGVPTDWWQYQDLTVRDGLWSFLHWRSTLTRNTDIYLTNDSREIAVFSSPLSNLWNQIKSASEPAILAPPVCDRYGTLIVEIPLNYEFSAGRAGTPTVWDVQLSDWREQIDIQRQTITPAGLHDVSGVYYSDSTTASAFFSLSPGHVFRRFGAIKRQERLALFSTQATNNQLAGLIHEAANNEYPNVDYRLSGNWRIVDIVPRQRVIQSISESDTERGIVWTDKKFLPRQISLLMNQGSMFVDMTCEAETGEAIATDGDPPPDTPPPPTPIPTPPPPTPEPEPPPSNLGAMVLCGGIGISPSQIAITFDFTATPPIWYDADPLNTLNGRFMSMAISGGTLEAYVTTVDPVGASPTTTGLWYCADISAAISGTISWSLIKSVRDASGESGYNPDQVSFGALWTNDDEVCAMVHSIGNFPPPNLPGAIAEVGSGGVVNPSPLGYYGILPWPAYSNSAYNDGTFRCVWGDPTIGKFYIACGCAGGGVRALVLVGDRFGFAVNTNYDPPEFIQMVAAHDGHVISWNNDIYGPNWAVIDTGYNGWRGSSIWTSADSTKLLHIDTPNYDLYKNGVLIGDADTALSGFGALMGGATACYLPGSNVEIGWLCGSAAVSGVNPIVIYSPDDGVTWSSKTGNLFAVLGANWSGWSFASTGNSELRFFEF